MPTPLGAFWEGLGGKGDFRTRNTHGGQYEATRGVGKDGTDLSRLPKGEACVPLPAAPGLSQLPWSIGMGTLGQGHNSGIRRRRIGRQT
jgi:hypothetical protein